MLKTSPKGVRRQGISPVAALILFLTCGFYASPQILATTHFGAGGIIAATSLPSLNTGIQPGFETNVGVSVAGNSAFIKSPASMNWKDSDSNLTWKLALDGSYQRFGQSAILSDGNSYRAFQAFGLGFMAGIQVPLFFISVSGRPVYFSVLAGGAIHVSNYIYTGLVSAYPAFAARLSADLFLGGSTMLRLDVPIEAAFRAGGTSLMAGLGVGLEFLPARGTSANGDK
jgi:hypothetical protein